MNFNVAYNDDARKMEQLAENMVDLVITSPPYFNLVNYNDDNQIGITETYDNYIKSLNKVWKRCIYALKENGTICINICNSLELTRKNNNNYFDIKHDIEDFFVNNDFYIEGTIIWNIYNDNYFNNQVVRYHEAYPSSKNIILNNYEYVLIFKRKKDFKQHNKDFSDTNLINCIWNIPWDYNTRPPAFPKDLVDKLILLYSKENDIILDPFMGQATTAIRALKNNRKFITYEINKDVYDIGIQKIKEVEGEIYGRNN